MYRKILVATDLTDASKPALRTALVLARRVGAAVTALHVTQPPYGGRTWLTPFGERDLHTLTALEQREAEAAERILVEQLREADPEAREASPITTSIRAGVAADVIVTAARELGVDLIVVGTHARKGISHALLGSIAERVLRSSPCPVLTVPPAGGKS